jgi:hypothetical protein
VHQRKSTKARAFFSLCRQRCPSQKAPERSNPLTAALNAKLAQDLLHQAPLGEAALQQVYTYEGGEGQPPLADEEWTTGYAKGE